jgi:hypothetical protein
VSQTLPLHLSSSAAALQPHKPTVLVSSCAWQGEFTHYLQTWEFTIHFISLLTHIEFFGKVRTTEIASISTFEDNWYVSSRNKMTRMGVVISLWVSLTSIRPRPSLWVAMTSYYDFWLTSSAPDNGCRQVCNLPKFSGKQSYKFSVSIFCHISRSNRNTQVMMLVSTQET